MIERFSVEELEQIARDAAWCHASPVWSEWSVVVYLPTAGDYRLCKACPEMAVVLAIDGLSSDTVWSTTACDQAPAGPGIPPNVWVVATVDQQVRDYWRGPNSPKAPDHGLLCGRFWLPSNFFGNAPFVEAMRSFRSKILDIRLVTSEKEIEAESGVVVLGPYNMLTGVHGTEPPSPFITRIDGVSSSCSIK